MKLLATLMTADAPLRELLAIANLPYPDDGRLTIRGSDPVVRTRYKVGTLAAATQAAIGIAVSELWKQRTGRPQRIAVDLRAAAIGLFVYKYSFLNGKRFPEIEPFDPWSFDPGLIFYPVRGGRWIRLTTHYPHLLESVLRTLGRPKDVAAAMKVTATWDGAVLEDAIYEAGGCAGFVRASEEWARHPQCAAVAAQPLLEIVRIGDAPPDRLPGQRRPLEGVRVLDLTRVVAGPIAARTLAEHGADVLKIHAAHLPDSGIGELDSGLGKRSAFIDLRTTQGIDRLRRLLGEADVFSQGYRPGSLAARGFSPEDVARLRPGIVYVDLSAWGTAGPWKDRRGYDPIVQSVSGMLEVPGDGSRPIGMPVAAIDYIAGYLLALGAIVALQRRSTEGGSWLVRTSLARVGRRLTDLGKVPESELASVAEPPAEEIARLSTETDSPAGRIRHLKGVLELSETPPSWALPPVPLGYHPPLWSSRA